jgi:Arc/MetJ-type ribon-helix-helix transcriptional regulator
VGFDLSGQDMRTKGGRMTTEIPNDLIPFVQRLVATRRFLSDEDVIAAGLRLLQAREALKDEVTKAFDQLDKGLGVSEAQVFENVENRITAIESVDL